METIKKNQKEQLMKNDSDNVHLLDTPPSMFDDKIIPLEFNLYDIKSVSEELRVALMVIIDSKECDYDVYYYNSKLREINY